MGIINYKRKFMFPQKHHTDKRVEKPNVPKSETTFIKVGEHCSQAMYFDNTILQK